MYEPDEDNDTLYREASLEQAEFEEAQALFGQEFSPFFDGDESDNG